MKVDKLTIKQRLFCKYYLANGFNGTQAAIKAGYSENSAQEIAGENLRKPLIASFIDSELKKMEKEIGLSKDWVLGKLKNCAEFSINEEAQEVKNHNALLGATDQINKLLGFYAEEKKEIKHDISDKMSVLIKQYEREC